MMKLLFSPAVRGYKPNGQLLLFGLYLVICIMGLLLLPLLQERFSPVIGDLQYRFGNEDLQTGQHPLFLPTQGQRFEVIVPLTLSRWSTRKFHVKPDDCIDDFLINDVQVDPKIARYCDYTEYGPLLDLSSYFHQGDNMLRLVIKDHGGLAGIRITPSRINWVYNLLVTLVVLLGLWSSFIFFPSFSRSSDAGLRWVFTGGILVRTVYFFATPYSVRSHDLGGHIEYIDYVAKYMSIPPAAQGWEFHQAPLYYFLAALWMKLGTFVGLTHEMVLQEIQMGSLLISILTLAAGAWLGHLLFPQKKDGKLRLFFLAFLGTFPALVFLSARITNETLYNFLAFLIIAFLVRWWRQGRVMDYFLLALFTGLAIVTRVIGLMFLGIITLCTICRRGETLVEKCKNLLFSWLLILFLVGWLPLIRFSEADLGNTITLGNRSMNPALLVQTTLRNFLTFNPLKILSVPFNNPWDDAARRQYFWEYLYRSAFFGEFRFPEELHAVSQALLALGMLLLLLIATGLIFAIVRKLSESLPMLLTFAFLPMALLAYRLYAPYGANQDMRFIVLIVVPLAYFLLEGMRDLPQKFQKLIEVPLTVFCLLSGFFLSMLLFYGT